MAVGFGSSSKAVRTATTDPYTWSHTASGTTRAVVLACINYTSNTNQVSTVKYGTADGTGGVSLTQIVTASDSTGEATHVSLWFYGASDVPTGNQSWWVDLASATADDIVFIGMTFTGNGPCMVVHSDSVSNDQTSSAQCALRYGGKSAMAVCAFAGGLAAVGDYTLTANCSTVDSNDSGQEIQRVDRQTTAGTSDFTIGYTFTGTDDVALAALALSDDLSQAVAGATITTGARYEPTLRYAATGATISAGSTLTAPTIEASIPDQEVGGSVLTSTAALFAAAITVGAVTVGGATIPSGSTLYPASVPQRITAGTITASTGHTLFTDGFESGSGSAWDTGLDQASGTKSYSNSEAYAGTYRLVSTTTGSATAYAALWNNNNASATGYWEGECWVKFTTVPGSVTGNSPFITGRIESLSTTHFAVRLGTTGKVQWTIRLRDGTGGYVLQSDLGDPPTDWTRVRVIRDTTGANPQWTLHYGANSYSYTDTTSGTIQSIDGLGVGWYNANVGTTAVCTFDQCAEYDVAAVTAIYAPTLRYRAEGATIGSGSALTAPTLSANVAGATISSGAVLTAPTLTAQVVGATIASGATLSGPTVALVTNKARLIPIPLSGWAFLGIGYGLSTGAAQNVTGATIAAGATLTAPTLRAVVQGATIASASTLTAPTLRAGVQGATINSGSALTAPTLRGVVSVSGASLPSGSALTAPALRYRVQGATISSGATLTAPTLRAQILTALIPSGSALTAPSITTRVVVSGATIGSTAQITAPSLQHRIAGTVIPSGSALTAPTLRYRVQLPTIPSGSALYGPSITTQGTIGASTIASGSALFAPTLRYQLQGATISSGSVLTAPSLRAQVTGATISSGSALYAPTLRGRVQGAFLPSGSALYAPSLTARVQGATIAAGSALYPPTVAVGASAVGGTHRASTAVLYPPTLTGEGAVSGAFIASGAVLTAPTVTPGAVAVGLPFLASGVTLTAPAVTVAGGATGSGGWQIGGAGTTGQTGAVTGTGGWVVGGEGVAQPDHYVQIATGGWVVGGSGSTGILAFADGPCAYRVPIGELVLCTGAELLPFRDCFPLAIGEQFSSGSLGFGGTATTAGVSV